MVLIKCISISFALLSNMWLLFTVNQPNLVILIVQQKRQMSGIDDCMISPAKKGDFEHEVQCPLSGFVMGQTKCNTVGACTMQATQWNVGHIYTSAECIP